MLAEAVTPVKPRASQCTVLSDAAPR